MYLIKNISKIPITIDSITIPPYQSVKFETIKDNLCLNKYINRNIIQINNVVDNIDTNVKLDNTIQKTNVIITTNIKNESTHITKESITKKDVEDNKVIEKTTKSIEKKKLAKTNENLVKAENKNENNLMKGEETDAAD